MKKKEEGSLSKLWGLWLAVFLLLFQGCDATKQKDDALLYELFDRIWAWEMEVYPESATYYGIPGGEDRWTDYSMEAIEQRKAQNEAWHNKIKEFEHLPLSDAARLQYAVLREKLDVDIEGAKYPSELKPINQLSGVQHYPLRLVKMMPATTVQEYEHILSRIEKVPALVEQKIALMKKGIEEKVTPPRITLRELPAQVKTFTVENVEQNPFWEIFAELPESFSDDEKSRIQAEAKKLLEGPVRNAYQELHDYLVQEYLPHCVEEVGLLALPNGKEWYEHNIKEQTTMAKNAKEIHELGKKEVARIYLEMQAIAKKNGHEEVADYGKALKENGRFYFATKEELVKEYRALCKKIDACLIRFFSHLPRLPYGIELIPAYAEKSAPAAYYNPGSAKAQRAGVFFVNGYDLTSSPSWEMEALAIHEAVPGHHLQLSLAQELEHKHELIRNTWFTAYGEGWALYCEKLGKEMGFYQTDESEFGRLNYEMWRAIRLVVDTGLHAKGWSRQQAIDYFLQYTSKAKHEVEVEVDHYLVWPGQALSYKVGEIKIWELRRYAESELGDDFDLRDFHDVLLCDGGMPLSLLQVQVENWVNAKRLTRE